jgi:hypothetical protein
MGHFVKRNCLVADANEVSTPEDAANCSGVPSMANLKIAPPPAMPIFFTSNFFHQQLSMTETPIKKRDPRRTCLGCLSLLAIAGMIFLGVAGGVDPHYSDGSRVGIVTKLSEKGVFWKSWEGEMLMALPASQAGTTQPEKFEFNVAPEAVGKVQAAMVSGQRVELVYRQWLVTPVSIDNDHVIIDVKPTAPVN